LSLKYYYIIFSSAKPSRTNHFEKTLLTRIQLKNQSAEKLYSSPRDLALAGLHCDLYQEATSYLNRIIYRSSTKGTIIINVLFESDTEDSCKKRTHFGIRCITWPNKMYYARISPPPLFNAQRILPNKYYLYYYYNYYYHNW